MPVSLTHVPCGSFFGIGAITRQARLKTINIIALAWVITLPVAGLLGCGAFHPLCHFLGMVRRAEVDNRQGKAVAAACPTTYHRQPARESLHRGWLQCDVAAPDEESAGKRAGATVSMA